MDQAAPVEIRSECSEQRNLMASHRGSGTLSLRLWQSGRWEWAGPDPVFALTLNLAQMSWHMSSMASRWEQDLVYVLVKDFKETVIQNSKMNNFPCQAQRWHVGNEPFGRQWQSGDVVGCMIDLTEMNIMFTLNGEMLISDSGSEMAFKDIEIGEGKYSNNWYQMKFSSRDVGYSGWTCGSVFLMHIYACMEHPQASYLCAVWACPRSAGSTWVRTSAVFVTLPSVACRRDLNPLLSTWKETLPCGSARAFPSSSMRLLIILTWRYCALLFVEFWLNISLFPLWIS